MTVTASRDYVVGGENKLLIVKAITDPAAKLVENALVIVTALVEVSPEHERVYLIFYIKYILLHLNWNIALMSLSGLNLSDLSIVSILNYLEM